MVELPESVKKLQFGVAEKHPKAICIANYKGGVGKTTMTTLIGYYLAKPGKKVLLIDIDAQCSLSLAVGFNLEKMEKPEFTIHNLVTPGTWSKITKTKFQDYIFSVPDRYAPETLKIIRGAFDVDELDIKIAQAIKDDENKNLHQLFLYCQQMIYSFNNFDYVLIDCPPNKMYLTQAMLQACPYYITVTIPDRISVFGVPRLKQWIDRIDKEFRPKLLGCILTTVNHARYLWSQFNTQGIRKHEPIHIAPEIPTLLNNIVDAFIKNCACSKEDVANTLCLNSEEFEQRFYNNRNTTLTILR